MTAALALTAVVSMLGALVYVGLSLWAAREDGRDQRRRDARRRR